MNKITVISVVALIIALVSLGLNLMPRNSVPISGSGGKTWRQIVSFSGTGNTTAPTFYVPSYRWDIHWNVTFGDQPIDHPSDDGFFLARVYSPGVAVENQENALQIFGDFMPKGAPAGWSEEGREEVQGVGYENFYIKIHEANVENWNIWIIAWS